MAFTVIYLDSLANTWGVIASTFASSTIESFSPYCGIYSVEEGDCGNSRIKSHLQHYPDSYREIIIKQFLIYQNH
jgi:hypothetical protein